MTVKSIVTALVVCMFLATMGCFVQVDELQAVILPAEVQYALDDPGVFRDKVPVVLSLAMPGDVIDPISEMDGCWGGRSLFPAAFADILYLYEIYSFDLVSSSFHRWSFIGTVEAKLIADYAFITFESGFTESRGNGSVDLVATSLATIDARTGTEQPRGNGAPVRRPSAVTVVGNDMVFWLDYDRGDDYASPSYLKRFTCP